VKAKTTFLICPVIILSLLVDKANSQAVTAADTSKLLCQKWIAVSRTINGQVYPIDESPVPLNKRKQRPAIDTGNFIQFNADKTFRCGGLWGDLNRARWQYLSPNRTVEVMDQDGKATFKLVRIDATHLSLASHGVTTNYETRK
jgi:hypothetical protein